MKHDNKVRCLEALHTIGRWNVVNPSCAILPTHPTFIIPTIWNFFFINSYNLTAKNNFF